MAHVKVKDQPHLYRDDRSNGIININEDEYSEYKRKKRVASALEEQKDLVTNRLNKIENDVNALKSGINQILELLKP